MAANFGGHDYSFVDKDFEKYRCNICSKILRDPHLTGCCGQHFCESCLKRWFFKHRKESCPHCRTEGEKFQYLIDKKLKREIDSLKIHCTNKEEGCQWIGEVGSLKDHLESADGCGYVEVECPNGCQDKAKTGPVGQIIPASKLSLYGIQLIITRMKQKHLTKHLTEECELRPYQCKHCGFDNTFEFITTNHYDDCPEFPLKCPNQCGVKNIKRKDMKGHRKQCPEEKVECSNGCKKFVPCRRARRARHSSRARNTIITLKRKNLAKHLTEECELRPYQCEHCAFINTVEYVTTEHYFKCLEFPLKCPNICGEDIKRKDMKDHRSQCPEEPVRCPFEEAGCKQKLVRRELEQHMSATQQHHLLMVMGAYKEMKAANEEMKQELSETKEELHLLKRRFDAK